MKLKDLIQVYHWLSVKQILFEINNQENNLGEYARIFNELKYLQVEKSPIILMIDRHWEDGEPTIYAHAYGLIQLFPYQSLPNT